MEMHWKFNLFGSNIMFMVESVEKMRQRERELVEMRARTDEILRGRKSVTPPVTTVTDVTPRVTHKPKPNQRVCQYCDEQPPLKDGQFACSARCRKRRERAKPRSKK